MFGLRIKLWHPLCAYVFDPLGLGVCEVARDPRRKMPSRKKSGKKWGPIDKGILSFLIRNPSIHAARSNVQLAKLFHCDEKTIRRHRTPSTSFRSPSSPRKKQEKIKKQIRVCRTLAKKEDPHGSRQFPSYKSLRNELLRRGVSLSLTTVRRRCASGNIVAKTRPRVPTAAPDAIHRTLAWSQSNLAHVLRNQHRFVFVDEWPGKSNDNGCRTQLCVDGEKPKVRVHKKSWPRVSCQAFCAIGKDFRFIFVLPWKGRKNETLNSVKYREWCLKPILHHLKSKKLILVQDGARVHWDRDKQKTLPESNREFLIKEKIQTLQLPANSPYLNPIENSFSIGNTRISHRLHEIHTKEDLKRVMIEEFNSIPQSTIHSLVDSFADRLRNVIAHGHQPVTGRAAGKKKKKAKKQ